MKGVILAGGLGTRLSPLTKATNKSLLPIYNRPMIYYPLQTLLKAGISEIILVCGGNSAGDFVKVLGDGKQFSGLRELYYAYQAEPKGIAHALKYAKTFVGDDPICVILGDNIFSEDLSPVVQRFSEHPEGAIIFGTSVNHPENYGVVETDEHGVVTKIVEKPKKPQSDIIATGLYMYDNTIWDFIDDLKPSARGEIEITDVNNHYLQSGHLELVRLTGYWADCGENFDGYLETCIHVQNLTRQGLI